MPLEIIWSVVTKSSVKKNEQINVPSITVDKNVIRYGESFICTDNISMISICPIPANKSWLIAIILGVVGIYLMQEGSIGILLLVVAIIWLIAVLVYNSNRGDNLAISLNSGSTLYFNCKDRAFLNKVVNAMLGSIKEKNQTTYSISFDKCQISGGVLHNSNLIER